MPIYQVKMSSGSRPSRIMDHRKEGRDGSEFVYCEPPWYSRTKYHPWLFLDLAKRNLCGFIIFFVLFYHILTCIYQLFAIILKSSHLKYEFSIYSEWWMGRPGRVYAITISRNDHIQSFTWTNTIIQCAYMLTWVTLFAHFNDQIWSLAGVIIYDRSYTKWSYMLTFFGRV